MAASVVGNLVRAAGVAGLTGIATFSALLLLGTMAYAIQDANTDAPPMAGILSNPEPFAWSITILVFIWRALATPPERRREWLGFVGAAAPAVIAWLVTVRGSQYAPGGQDVGGFALLLAIVTYLLFVPWGSWRVLWRLRKTTGIDEGVPPDPL